MKIDMGISQTQISEEACVATITCPNSYFAYPQLVLLKDIPSSVFSTLDYLWKRSIHIGRPVKIYHLKNVFVVKEGLVFNQQAQLIDVTRTYHEDEAIESGSIAVREVIGTGAVSTVPKGILAKSRGSANYGHFLVEMLPRAWMARTRLALNGWPAIIDSALPAMEEIAKQALRQAGFALDEMIALGPDPVFFDDLMVVDGLTWHTSYLSPIVMECLDVIAGNVLAGSNPKIYAPRRPSIARDFEDETEIARRLASIGYHETPTASLSFVDQIAAFKGAEAVVAVSGAALTNIVFCKPGTKVYNFSPTSASEVLFWMISESRRLRYYEVRCEEVGPQLGLLPWDRSLKISPNKVAELLQMF